MLCDEPGRGRHDFNQQNRLPGETGTPAHRLRFWLLLRRDARPRIGVPG
jgi:hypothetical protein